ncbi:hypothetical protein RRG08_010528 [Elysia crispata]|uniref:Uncharacterized protein n=1 Tax=Elysia crispata TaxID=231223 RepID=A0AAE1E351_9GAST|nr:hypothetical protein RRG08_010528 [Elysia crispata]
MNKSQQVIWRKSEGVEEGDGKGFNLRESFTELTRILLVNIKVYKKFGRSNFNTDLLVFDMQGVMRKSSLALGHRLLISGPMIHCVLIGIREKFLSFVERPFNSYGTVGSAVHKRH